MAWFYRSGELAKQGWDVVVDGTLPGWQHTGLRVGSVSNQDLTLEANENERIIFALEGKGLHVEYSIDGGEWQLADLRGRESVFHGTTDLLYVPLNTAVKISGDGRVAVGEAPARNAKPARLITREEVPVFVRGAGRESRQVHNFGVPEVLDADRFVVVEVIVPAGNWSGIPPHKHDTYVPGVESNLEEIYYFEAAQTRGSSSVNSDPYGLLRVYASDEREIDVLEEVRSGDVGLVPFGWHGPVSAAPGADLYFFNIMAGPDPDRSWNITDDPNHAWIRDTWKAQDPDPRLPYEA
jgi:5-deoxy-glucuronate isomerase